MERGFVLRTILANIVYKVNCRFSIFSILGSRAEQCGKEKKSKF